MLYDQARIFVQSGKGGDGCISFRREKHVPYGGPDGGDGGRGGHVYLVVEPRLNTLISFQRRQHFRAPDGRPGRSARRHGADGADLEIPVPPGTVVRGVGEEAGLAVDLLAPGQRLLVARGGRGGRGNAAFATPTHQAPRLAEKGEPGEGRWLQLELKLIADVGLVGYPNAGKSTLLAAVSAARPKIAPYPFTTLSPNLGVVTVGDFSFILADIPGLIEGASQGAGLGLDFLRHIERTRLLIHILDGAGVDGRDPLADYQATNRELARYSPELAARRQLVAVNKMDLPAGRARYETLRLELPIPPEDIFPISAATGEGVSALMKRAAALLQELPPAYDLTPRQETLLFAPPPADERAFTVEREGEGFRIRGIQVERLAAMTDFENEEASDRFQRFLRASGIEEALRQAGIQEGDTVRIGSLELYWHESPFLEDT
ncbi:MAG: GTPase ObgE [Chloroflexia bacterium]